MPLATPATVVTNNACGEASKCHQSETVIVMPKKIAKSRCITHKVVESA